MQKLLDRYGAPMATSNRLIYPTMTTTASWLSPSRDMNTQNWIEPQSLAPKKPANVGAYYPDGHSSDMRFDMSMKNDLSWLSATPIWVQNDRFLNPGLTFSRIKMSYRIRIRPDPKAEPQRLSKNIPSPSLDPVE